MKGGETAARRYARALLDVALEKGDEGLRQDLADLARLFSDSPELRAVLRHPGVPAEKKTAVVASLWRRGTSSPLLQRLVALLVERDRVEILPLIADAYRRLWHAHHDIVEADAVSARDMDGAEIHVLSAAVGRALGKQVELRHRVDESLIGGLQLRMEGRVYDGSVRSRLRALRERLAGTET